MAIHRTLTQAQAAVRSALEGYFADAASAPLALEPWGPDVQRRLAEYALRGKLIRGAMVVLGWRLSQTEDIPNEAIPAAVLDTAVAMELLQSFLLIHDDIMDQDELRRGGPSVHAQYTATLNPGDPHYGVSMGICAGDVSAFLALDLLARISADPATVAALMQLVSREIVIVGLAQMQDVHHGYVPQASRDAILQVYTYKTGRYTFSLPLMSGALLAGAPVETQKALSELGEALGRIFQIRDDQLGLFGDSSDTGKPTGSDIRENKKTIFQAELRDRAPDDDPVLASFGNESIGSREIEAVRARVEQLGVTAAIEEIVQRDATQCREIIDRMSLSGTGREALTALLAYNLARTV